MAEEEKDKPKVFLKFRATQKSPTLEIGHGEYTRKFEAKDQPFECDEEEAGMLKRTGFFVDAKDDSEKEEPPAVDLFSDRLSTADGRFYLFPLSFL